MRRDIYGPKGSIGAARKEIINGFKALAKSCVLGRDNRSARKLIGAMLGASVVKTRLRRMRGHAALPDVRTIFEIGGQDSKIILIDDGVVVDYAMNTLCAAGTGSFLSSQAKRLGIDIEEFGEIAQKSDNPTKIAARCTVFAESDMVHKAQIGHKKEDIVAGLCYAVVSNYLNNVGKGKAIKAPIVFQGGVSKNAGVVKAFEKITGEKILVDANSHLMGALGVAILAKDCAGPKPFDFDISDVRFEKRGYNCPKCQNNCEIICFFRNGELIESWGGRCANGNDPRHSVNNIVRNRGMA